MRTKMSVPDAPCCAPWRRRTLDDSYWNIAPGPPCIMGRNRALVHRRIYLMGPCETVQVESVPYVCDALDVFFFFFKVFFKVNND